MQLENLSQLSLHEPVSLHDNQRAQASDKEQEKEVAASFETMFLQQMLKGMRETGFGGKKEFGRQTFEEMFDEQIARAVAGQGIGLGEAIFAEQTPAAAQGSAPAVDSGESGAVATPRPGQRGL